ncbi:hypothetical protein ACIBKX_09710 [Streptomyces sp. NPDC050658]|uniref:hypothetical protein n=1 Tax=unclassified Streptomyces TaxID=2593676 RepID=UPI00343AA7B8
MFKNWRARKQAELHEELAAALWDADPDVRGKAAVEAAERAQPAWALCELALAMERETATEEPFTSMAGGFADALWRDRELRRRAEAVFTANLADPESFVRQWTALVAELGGPAAPHEVSADLREDARDRLGQLRELGWTAQGITGAGRPDSVAYEMQFGVGVMLACVVLRRATPLPESEAERLRARTRATLEEALATEPNSKARAELLVPLAQGPAEPSWTDWPRIGLEIDEAVAQCATGEPRRVTLGVEALAHLLNLNHVLRYDAVRATLDGLVARDLEPFALSQVLDCYDSLHRSVPLTDPPLPLFLDCLGHADERVRTGAATGLEELAVGGPEEGRVVRALIDVLDHDPEDGVRWMTAGSLAGMRCADKANAQAAGDALRRYAQSPVAEIRAQSMRDALRQGTPDAYDWLLREFENPDMHWHFITAFKIAALADGFRLPSDIRPGLAERLERLAASRWADRCADTGAFPDVADREEMLAELLDAVREAA